MSKARRARVCGRVEPFSRDRRGGQFEVYRLTKATSVGEGVLLHTRKDKRHVVCTRCMMRRIPPSLSCVLCPVSTVCVSVLEQVSESMSAADRKNQDKIEAAIDTFCGQRLSARDDKMVSDSLVRYHITLEYLLELSPWLSMIRW